jgi:predicted transcriptional regulator
MSEVDHKVVQAIVNHGGSVSLIELMSLLGDVPDSEIEGAVKRLEDKNLVRRTNSDEEADPIITVREAKLAKELENLEDVA